MKSPWDQLPANVDPDELMSPPKLAALFPWVRPRALDEAAKARRVGWEQGKRPSDRLLSPRSFLEDCRALDPCRAPGCGLPGLRDNGGCGIKGHGHLSAKRRPDTGRRISAAKHGQRQVERAPDELTLTEAIRGTRLSHDALTAGCASDKLRHRVVARPGNQSDVIVFRRSELDEDLAACTCMFPSCRKPAPGDSNRCGDHAAKGEPAVELVCQYEPCGRRFTRPVSWLRERDGRGHFCRNKCKGLAFDAARPGHLATLNPDGAREHHAAIAGTIRADQQLDTVAAAKATALSPSTMRQRAREAGGEIRLFGGTARLVYAPEDLGDWFRRERGSNAAFGRLNTQLSAANGTVMGRTPALRQAEIAVATRLRDEKGMGYRRIAAALNQYRPTGDPVSHMAVKRALDRSVAVGTPLGP